MKKIPLPKLTKKHAKASGWKIKQGLLVRDFAFKDYAQTTKFVKGIIKISIREDHHPKITFGYKDCRVFYKTDSVNAITAKDFKCAARVNTLLKRIKP